MFDTYLFRVLLLPASVVLSVMFGGSYASGREIVEFISRHGPLGGLVSILAIILGFGIVAALCFELARVFRVWDYRSLLKVLRGGGWFLYEVIVRAGLLVGLAVVSTVAGTLLQDRFGTPVWQGTVLVFTAVVALNYRGRQLVERSMVISVFALFLVLAGLLFYFLSWSDRPTVEVFVSQKVVWSAWKSGITYAIFNASYLPLLLFCARNLTTRRESFTAGFFCALVMVIPAIVFHVVFMGDYPSIIDERLPTYFMFEKIAPDLMINLYIIVLFVMIIQTGVGLLQGFIERLDVGYLEYNGRPLPDWGHGIVAGFMLLSSVALGSLGIIALIAGAYAYLSVAFVIVFIVPLLVRGSFLILRAHGQAN
jgi:uncharacterized membrane protein YkvI